MVRKHKLLKTLIDLKLDKQVRDPKSVRSKLQSNRSSKFLSPPMMCHGSESCGCYCHYAKDDPPPCYTCCQDQDQESDSSLAQKVLLGKKDSLSRGKSQHLKDYVLRDEFGVEIPRYRKKLNKKSLHLSKMLNDESSSTLALNAKDSLRVRRDFSVSDIDDLKIEKLLIAANKSSNHRVMVNNIFNRDSRMNTILSEEEIESRLSSEYHQPQAMNPRIPSLPHHPPTMHHRIPTQCRQQLQRPVPRKVVRDNFGLEVTSDSSREGCTVS